MTLHVDRIDLADAIRTGVNPYLVGPYAPTHDELTLTDLEVVGEIPDDLNGVYVRNGPNPQHEPNGRYHWFDGDAMVHSVHIADGQATYRNRWVRTDGFEREREAGAPLWKGIIESPDENPPGEPEKDTANTDVVFHNEKLLALWYRAGKPYALDPVTLETLGAEDFDGTLRCEVSAHAKADTRTGELMFFDYGMERPYMRYGVVSPEGVVRHFIGIDLPGPRLPHDMAITDRHSILMDLPLYNDPEATRHGRFKLSFDRDTPSRFGVIPRFGDSCRIRWFEAAPCFIYHSVNAWEEGDEVVMDVCRVKHPEPRTDLEGPLANVLSYLRLDAHLHRYRFNLRTGKTTEQTIDDDNSEFPSINNNVLGTPSRWAYTMHISPESTLLFDGLMKYDVHTGAAETHWFGDGRWGSEAPFAPRPGATEEDDGYLVSYVYDEREGRSEVEVLDARDVTAGALCRIKLPTRVPIGFHATWVPGEELPRGLGLMPTYVLGGFQTDFARNVTKEGGDVYSLLEEAVQGALEETEVPAADVDVAHVGNLAAELFCGQAQLGGMVAAIDPAFGSLPTSRHEAACASGSVATLAAMAELEAERYDVALVVGVELMRNVDAQTAAEHLGSAAWNGREATDARFPWPALFSEIADAYGERWGLEYEHLGRIAELNFANASRNPKAQAREWEFERRAFTQDDGVNPVIEGRLRKQDCGRITDGAAAVVLASPRYAAAHAGRTGRSLDDLPVIRGWGHRTAPMLLADKLARSADSPYLFAHLREAITDAYRRAGIAGPDDLDLIETHDCFTITEYTALDHFGLTEPGQSWQAVEEGVIEPGGRLPVNPSGGLIGLGHPVGATGVRMLLDASRQVTGAAEDCQVDGARTAATLNVGGSCTTVVSFIVGR